MRIAQGRGVGPQGVRHGATLRIRPSLDFTIALLLLEHRDRHVRLEPDREEDTYDRFMRQR